MAGRLVTCLPVVSHCSLLNAVHLDESGGVAPFLLFHYAVFVTSAISFAIHPRGLILKAIPLQRLPLLPP